MTKLHQMNDRLRVMLGVLAAVVGCTVLRAPAQDAALPSGKDVVEKYIEATGGREAHERVESRVIHSTLKIPAIGIEGTSETYLQAPNKGYSVADLGQAGKEERGCDGTIIWESTTTGGPRVITDAKELEFWQRIFDMDSDLNLEKFYSSVETKGVEDFDGKPAYKVVFTTPGGQTETRYFDRESGLVVKIEQVVPSAMGPIPAVSVQSDYRDVDGLKIPHKVEETIAGQIKILVTLDKIEHNVEIPTTRFEPPAEVKALAERAKSPTTVPASGAPR